jgi:hypothetical protein
LTCFIAFYRIDQIAKKRLALSRIVTPAGVRNDWLHNRKTMAR